MTPSTVGLIPNGELTSQISDPSARKAKCWIPATREAPGLRAIILETHLCT